MRIIIISLSIIFTYNTLAQASPGHCWYYLHNKLQGNTFDECLQKAQNALTKNGYENKIRNSSDQYITYARARTDNVSIDVLCYEVNGDRGKVMSFITVSGNSACRVAEAIFKSMKN